MGKFSFKCVTKDAVLSCTFCPGGKTKFVTPVPNQNIIKEQGRELAVKNDITIRPFPHCMMATPPPPCTPILNDWLPIDKFFKTDNKIILIEKSLNLCSKGGIVSISNKKQDIITVDLANIIAKAMKFLLDMIDFRLDQYNKNRTQFDACFMHWFGSTAQKDVGTIIDRMNKIKNLVSNTYLNANGNINEKYFEIDFDPYNTPIQNKNINENLTKIFAYVRRKDLNLVVNIAPATFGEETNISAIDPITGKSTIDSMAGVIAHEVSHFTKYGNTEDHAYGRNKCERLALKNSPQALENADSFEYFLESGVNCP
jgi:hypothetical protein